MIKASYPVIYFKFENEQLTQEKIHLSIPISSELRDRDKREEGKCFLNSYFSANENFDFVGGFFYQGSMIFEHAWNREKQINSIIDVTIPTAILENADMFAYVEIFCFSSQEAKKLFSKIKDKNEIYMRNKKMKDRFIDARPHILNHFKPVHIKWIY